MNIDISDCVSEHSYKRAGAISGESISGGICFVTNCSIKGRIKAGNAHVLPDSNYGYGYYKNNSCDINITTYSASWYTTHINQLDDVDTLDH